jgi:hypothetical protein
MGDLDIDGRIILKLFLVNDVCDCVDCIELAYDRFLSDRHF